MTFITGNGVSASLIVYMGVRVRDILRDVAFAVLSLCLAGCVSMGTNYDPAIAASLTPGLDRADVITRLGEPTTVLTLASGEQHLVWTYSTGSLAGAKARSLTLLFGADGRLVRMLSEVKTVIR